MNWKKMQQTGVHTRRIYYKYSTRTTIENKISNITKIKVNRYFKKEYFIIVLKQLLYDGKYNVLRFLS